MLVSLLVVCSLLGCCYALSFNKRWPVETTPILSVSLIITTLYAFAYCQQLKLGASIVLVLGLVFFCLAIASFLFKRMDTIKPHITPGMTTWFVITLIFAVYASCRWMHVWDDFAEWGPHAKAMFLHNEFWSGVDYGADKQFPPGPPLFYYFFTFLNNYSESVLFFAQTFLFLAPLAVLLQRINWRRWELAAFGFMLIILFYLLLYNAHIGYHVRLGVDEAIGLFVGAILAIYYLSSRQYKDIVLLLPIVFSLSLLKPKLGPFAVMIMVLIISDQLYQIIKTKAQTVSIKLFVINVLASVLVIMTYLLASKSWHAYLSAANISAGFGSPLSIKGIAAILSGHMSQYESLVLKKFITYLPNVAINVVPPVILGVLACFWEKDRFKRNNLIVWQAILFLGFFAYLLGILLVFLFSFKNTQTVVWSMMRFYRIYLIAWSFFSFSVLFRQLNEGSITIPKKLEKGLAIFAVMGLLVNLAVWTIEMQKQPAHMKNFVALHSIAVRINEKTPPSSKIFIVYNGLPFNGINRLNYFLMPREVSNQKLLDSSVNEGWLSKVKEEKKHAYIFFLNKQGMETGSPIFKPRKPGET